jgi:hypothetical protein
MELKSVDLSAHGVALDMVALFLGFMAWTCCTWLPLGFLILAATRSDLAAAIGAVVVFVLGLITAWVSRGLARRKRFRSGAAGLLLIGFALLMYFGNASLPSEMAGPQGPAIFNAIVTALFGLALIVAVFRKVEA